jgi:hypothetical protein
MGEMKHAYRFEAEKAERKKPLERPRRLWKNNIKMDHKGTGCKAVDWIYLGHYRDTSSGFL